VRIQQYPAVGTLAGNEAVPVAKLSATVTLTRTDISAQASDNSFNTVGGNFVTAGFAVGKAIRVEGFTGNAANNIYCGVLTAVAAGKLTIGGTDGDVIVDDAAGESVTITQWEAARATADELAGTLRNTSSALSISSGTVNIDLALGDYFTLALTANVTSITFSNLPGSGKGASVMIRITQDSTARTVAWPASFKWAGGSVGAVSTGSGAVDVLAITTFDNGTAWAATLAKAFA
jgi:hypothetical protein